LILAAIDATPTIHPGGVKEKFRVLSSKCQVKKITNKIKVDRNAKIAAVCVGGNEGDWHGIEHFVGRKSAGNERSTAEMRQTRREQARMLPRRRLRHCTAGAQGLVAKKR
jgi:hypothetical protein